ncbi:hypothetical protein RhiirA1_471324 [Rhizophagus irregularis]|uniref:C2H2-type domain-containing protein n=1 Tax=Rhizophagus irregularis TaxID=588596 RepID=A0A2N0R4K2_9GLOM|nr:hypothetical protein RhiirA1_471324 [Rhizophagus irregularis]
MSLLCPYKGCNRTFSKHQSLSQHIRKSHSVIVEYEINDEVSDEININEGDADLFQDEKLFENLNLKKLEGTTVETQKFFDLPEEMDDLIDDDDAEEEINNSNGKMDDSNEEMDDSNEEMDDDSNEEMDDSNEEIDDSNEEMNDSDDFSDEMEGLNDLNDDDSDTEIDSVDSEDFHGAKFEDAVNETLDDSVLQWPNETYREFAKICVDYDLSNQAVDSFINFFNKNANLNKSPLPNNSREMHKFMNSIVSPNLDFKKKHIIDFEGISYNLHYRPIIKTIKALLQKPDITNNFILKFEEKRQANTNSRIFSEQYNCNWWQQTESQLKIGSRVLSIILYSDATLCDSLGKTQQHPVFLTLGNIPSWQRNKKNAKVLLGYMPILQSKNQATRNSDNFRKLIRKVTKRCWSILLHPIMKLDELELNIKNVQITFAPRISVFLADMLEANAITCTYKSANCKMPCPSCIVHIEDLNNMKISKENITLRTPNSMASVIQNKKAKKYSIHDQKNIFWNFP